MSIAVLKRKSQRFLVPISGANCGPGGPVFSLNGGYRNQRAIGDTNLAQLKKSAELCYANDPAIIKPKATSLTIYGTPCAHPKTTPVARKTTGPRTCRWRI